MGIDASFIIGALDHDSVAEVLVTFIHLFSHPTGDFLGALHSCGTWRKGLHKPVPLQGGEMICSYE